MALTIYSKVRPDYIEGKQHTKNCVLLSYRVTCRVIEASMKYNKRLQKV